MSNSKLIVVEGIPGSGKTTAAKFIKGLLDEAGIKNELYNEGNLDHPADFESMACLSGAEYNKFLERFQEKKSFLKDNVIIKGDNHYFCYGKLRNEKADKLQDELFNELLKYDVCDALSLQRYQELTLERWREFAERAGKEDKVYIFECCFIQNPTVIMLARHFTDKMHMINHVLELENIIKPLNPKLVYFYQESVRETIKRVAEVRDKAWINFVIDYVCNQTYGKTLNLSGFDGAVKFFEDRREIELMILEKLTIDKSMLDNSEYNWEKCYEKIKDFLNLSSI
jgi:hypothetical protein